MRIVTSKEWKNINDLKLDYTSVDYVSNHRFLFNIKSNAYKLIAIILFNVQKVYIRFIGTQTYYDKINDLKKIIMTKTEKEYNAITERTETLLQNPENIENIENKEANSYIMLNLLSDFVTDYEEEFHPVKKPSLIFVIKLRMAEMGLNQKRLSELLVVSSSLIIIFA